MKIQIEKVKLAVISGKEFFEFKALFRADDGREYRGTGKTEAQCIRQLALSVSLDELRGKAAK